MADSCGAWEVGFNLETGTVAMDQWLDKIFLVFSNCKDPMN